MNKIELWILKRIIKKEISQNITHKNNIINLYQIIRNAIESEFTEDNYITTDNFLLECFTETQKESLK